MMMHYVFYSAASIFCLRAILDPTQTNDLWAYPILVASGVLIGYVLLLALSVLVMWREPDTMRAILSMKGTPKSVQSIRFVIVHGMTIVLLMTMGHDALAVSLALAAALFHHRLSRLVAQSQN